MDEPASDERPNESVSKEETKVNVGVNTSPKSTVNSISSDEDMVCSICFEEWDNSGAHRVVTLKCGHLFGKSCVERWLKGHRQCCPQCNCKSRRTDIRNVYARAVKVKDTSERDRALKDLEVERAFRLNLEIEIQRLKLQLSQTNEQLQKEREKKISPRSNETLPAVTSADICLKLNKMLEIRDGQCRVMATTSNANIMAVSQFTNNKLFPSYGVRKITTNYLTLGEFIPLHKESIRDMAFHPGRQNGLLLTASTDKSLKLACMSSNSVVHTFHTDSLIWACTWNQDEENHLYAGCQDGSVLLFDMRRTNSHLQKLPSTGSAAPVTSLQHVPHSSTDINFGSGGLLVGQLNRCSFIESLADDYRTHILPIRGPVTSISFENNFRHMLVSCRPNEYHPVMSHTIYDLAISNSSCVCNVIYQFYGGGLERMLAKNLLLTNPFNSQEMLACAGDEGSLSTMVWNVQNGKRLIEMPSHRQVIGVNSFNNLNNPCLTTLTENSVSIYTFSLG